MGIAQRTYNRTTDGNAEPVPVGMSGTASILCNAAIAKGRKVTIDSLGTIKQMPNNVGDNKLVGVALESGVKDDIIEVALDLERA